METVVCVTVTPPSLFISLLLNAHSYLRSSNALLHYNLSSGLMSVKLAMSAAVGYRNAASLSFQEYL
jgi:hypothetical protein